MKPDPTSTSPKTISLVLGGGGARGLAHIGVIRWLIENDYRIASIAGSSMGALIGGIYATGKLPVYAQWVIALERMQVLRLLDPSFGRDGLFKGDRVMGVLRELIGDHEIEDLPISFTAVAADFDSGEEVWLQSGKLFDAIRASIATPLVFTPFRLGEQTLVDGALVNPVPVAPTLSDATALTIAVSLSGPAEERPAPPTVPPEAAYGNVYTQRISAFLKGLQSERTPRVPSRGMFDIAFLSMQTMQHTITRLTLGACEPDVLIEVPRNACGYYEFWRAQEMIDLGYERAARAFAASAD